MILASPPERPSSDKSGVDSAKTTPLARKVTCCLILNEPAVQQKAFVLLPLDHLAHRGVGGE